MKTVLVSLFATVCLASFSYSQQPAATPPAESDEAVVKVSTDLIQIDVTVTDKNGKVVPNLAAQDFEIFENGKRQTVSGFSFVSRTIGGAAAAGTDNRRTVTQTPVQQEPLSKTAVRRTIAIIVDDIQLSFGSIDRARRALREFVDTQMQPTDLVAIIRTGGGVGALQQFTSDKRVLHAAIDRLRWNPAYGTFDALSSVSQNDADITERFRRESDNVASGKSKQTTVVLTGESSPDRKSANAARNASVQQSGAYVQSSLGVVRYVLAGMKALPGRKAMMFFSDGIDITDPSVKSRSSTTLDYLQDIAEMANRSSVVVYTFDTKGMRSMSIAASDSTYEIIDGHRGAKEIARRTDFQNSQDGLVYFANRTGGRAFLNSDNFGYGIQRALDEQDGYYLLAYVPDADSFDAAKSRFNKLEINVKRPGLNVSHRSGFFNRADDAPTKTETADRKLADALMSPFTEDGIELNINALYANDKADGAYLRSFLHIDARNLLFKDDPEGWKRATFDVVATAFGDNGVPADTKASEYTIKTKGATYQSMLDRGFVYVLPLPLRKPGLYQLRVAVRDKETGKIGSAFQIVDVPDLTKRTFTLSSLAVENVSVGTWRNIAAGKVGNQPGQIQVPSTLLYDTVLRKFTAGSILRYGCEVYDGSARSGTNRLLEIRASIYRDNSVVLNGNLNKTDVSSQKDPQRVAISGAITLPEFLAAGDYVLHIEAYDRSTDRSATQIFPFEIVK